MTMMMNDDKLKHIKNLECYRYINKKKKDKLTMLTSLRVWNLYYAACFSNYFLAIFLKKFGAVH